MNELLLEFLASVLNENQSNITQQVTALALEKKPGVGLYGPKGKDIVTHRSRGGKLIPVADKKPAGTNTPDSPKPNVVNKRPTRRKRKLAFDPAISRTENNPFTTKSIFPEESFTTIHDTDTGNLEISGISINKPEDITTFVNARIAEWTRVNQKATPDETNATIRKLTLIAHAIHTRNNILQKLKKEGKQVVQISPQNIEPYITNVLNVIGNVTTNQTTISKLKKEFTELQNPESTQTPVSILENIFKICSEDSELSSRGRLPTLAEHLSALHELKTGRTVIMPVSESEATVDVISITPIPETLQGNNIPTDVLLEHVHTIYSGVSVKRDEGGASSCYEKTNSSAYEDHANTTHTLRTLSKVSTLFAPSTYENVTAEIKTAITQNLNIISAYYGLPDNATVDDVFKMFSNGGIVCVKTGTPPNQTLAVSPQKTAWAPVTDDMDDLNKSMYQTYFVMIAAWEAIYNSKVIAQGFGSHSWTDDGLKTADGINEIAKQRRKGYKGKIVDLETGFTRPDRVVSNNLVVGSDELRTGNPCRKLRNRSK